MLSSGSPSALLVHAATAALTPVLGADPRSGAPGHQLARRKPVDPGLGDGAEQVADGSAEEQEQSGAGEYEAHVHPPVLPAHVGGEVVSGTADGFELEHVVDVVERPQEVLLGVAPNIL